ncbi:hypothetical protein M514_05810 [Trichuris suis]|uniref:Uncharacterized protein n=1 Tax=Trichuris suis TaxID=68888 RepID=A0A085M7Y3_9BILA|nr:hypothetical protein M513_05810 [Trichuris suis]KFD66422.1 hypothetical protein M514_05810 [Trichuris suis]
MADLKDADDFPASLIRSLAWSKSSTHKQKTTSIFVDAWSSAFDETVKSSSLKMEQGWPENFEKAKKRAIRRPSFSFSLGLSRVTGLLTQPNTGTAFANQVLRFADTL